MLRLETSTLRLVPPPPSIKPQPTPVFQPIMTPNLGRKVALWDVGADEISPGLQPPEAPTNLRVIP
jgi:hypothetical protein